MYRPVRLSIRRLNVYNALRQLAGKVQAEINELLVAGEAMKVALSVNGVPVEPDSSKKVEAAIVQVATGAITSLFDAIPGGGILANLWLKAGEKINQWLNRNKIREILANLEDIGKRLDDRARLLAAIQYKAKPLANVVAGYIDDEGRTYTVAEGREIGGVPYNPVLGETNEEPVTWNPWYPYATKAAYLAAQQGLPQSGSLNTAYNTSYTTDFGTTVLVDGNGNVIKEDPEIEYKPDGNGGFLAYDKNTGKRLPLYDIVKQTTTSAPTGSASPAEAATNGLNLGTGNTWVWIALATAALIIFRRQ